MGKLGGMRWLVCVVRWLGSRGVSVLVRRMGRLIIMSGSGVSVALMGFLEGMVFVALGIGDVVVGYRDILTCAVDILTSSR